MNKDFWERIDRLEELAGKATRGKWIANDNCVYCGIDSDILLANIDIPPLGYGAEKIAKIDAAFIAAANPAMIQEMIAELRRLEKEADCLATFLADICDYVANTDCCPVAEACVCPRDKCKDANKPEIWREEARKLVELRTDADNA